VGASICSMSRLKKGHTCGSAALICSAKVANTPSARSRDLQSHRQDMMVHVSHGPWYAMKSGCRRAKICIRVCLVCPCVPCLEKPCVPCLEHEKFRNHESSKFVRGRTRSRRSAAPCSVRPAPASLPKPPVTSIDVVPGIGSSQARALDCAEAE
jgi:hypothetical protein